MQNKNVMFFGLFFIGLVLSSCSVETQKGRESFYNNQLPEALEKIANQSLEISTYKSQIVARVNAEDRSKVLPIAVIDNGTDLAHPDLINQIDYTVENGKITAAGFDVMGEDLFPSPNLINPNLFAFSAQAIQNGLIVPSQDNVITILLKMDADFRNELFAAFQADPILNKSLFGKLSLTSFNLPQVHKLVHNDEAQKTTFDLEKYEKNKKDGILMSPDFREQVKTNKELQKFSLPAVYFYLDQPSWKMNEGMMVLNNMDGTENGDRAFEILLKTYNQFNQKAAYEKGLSQIAEFKKQRNHSPTFDKVGALMDGDNLISNAIEFHKTGLSSSDSLTAFASTIANVTLFEMNTTREKTEYPVYVYKFDDINTALKSAFSRIDLYINLVKNVKKSANESFEHNAFLKRYVYQKNIVEEFLTQRKADLPFIVNANYQPADADIFRKYKFRNSHPYLSSSSASESHGTHTAGVVAKQNPGIRIYPVRVTTRSALVTVGEKERLLNNFLASFKQWLSEPIVIKAIITKMPQIVPGVTDVPADVTDREKVAALIMGQLQIGIEMAFEDNALDFLFFAELEKAILHVVDKKIKIASISLGAETQLNLPEFSKIDAETDVKALFNFLNYEYFKYNLGKLLATKAQNTLFVVAAGNASKWIDSETHSALPADLSSMFFKPFEEGPGMIAPNNHVKNLLAVGSLNQNLALTAFPNISLNSSNPFIFTEGEYILSPVKGTDYSGVEQIIAENLKSISPALSIDDDRLKDEVVKLPEFSKIKEDNEKVAKINVVVSNAFSLVNNTNSNLRRYLALKYSNHRSKMSGTSMATPAVAGYVGDMVLKKAAQLGVKTTEIYDKAEFSPDVLIDELMAQSTKVFPASKDILLKKIDVLAKYDKGTKIQDLEAYLNQVKAPKTVTPLVP